MVLAGLLVGVTHVSHQGPHTPSLTPLQCTPLALTMCRPYLRHCKQVESGTALHYSAWSGQWPPPIPAVRLEWSPDLYNCTILAIQDPLSFGWVYGIEKLFSVGEIGSGLGLGVWEQISEFPREAMWNGARWMRWLLEMPGKGQLVQSECSLALAKM